MTSIDVSSEGPVRILRINNPKKRNAFSGDMGTELDAQFERADLDPSVRAVVVTGEGEEAFSSGHDLEEVLARPETASDPAANAGFTRPARITKPVIGAVNGAAYAAGFILALNCDLRVAGRNAQFCAVGAKIGLVPVGGQLSRILNVMTYPLAFKVLATAAPFDAEEAKSCGFVTEVCDPADTVGRAVAFGQQIAAVSPAVVQSVKTGLSVTLARGLTEGLNAEVQLAGQVRDLPDGEEGVQAFLESRAAAYPDAPVEFTHGLRELIP